MRTRLTKLHSTTVIHIPRTLFDKVLYFSGEDPTRNEALTKSFARKQTARYHDVTNHDGTC